MLTEKTRLATLCLIDRAGALRQASRVDVPVWGAHMARIGIVDDEHVARDQIQAAIERYGSENNIEFHVDSFTCAGSYLANRKHDYDILFLDIDMPGMSGMELAQAIRLTDKRIVLIFCTNLQQFAVNGYEVSALGFLVKPVEWYPFCLYLQRALQSVALRESLHAKEGKKILVKDGSTTRMVDVSNLVYVEVRKHKLLYLVDDRASGNEATFQSHGSMRGVAAELAPYGFARCAASYLVNLSRVTAVNSMNVHLGERVVPIGRAFKDDFRRDLSRYLATREWEAPQQ